VRQQELPETDGAYRQALFRLVPSLEDFSALGREFLQMIKKRDSQAFLPWLKRAKSCPAEEMRRFALGLENESAVALAALTEPWSTAQVEGQITRLKLLNRLKPQLPEHKQVSCISCISIEKQTSCFKIMS
jgi:transposase